VESLPPASFGQCRCTLPSTLPDFIFKAGWTDFENWVGSDVSCESLVSLNGIQLYILIIWSTQILTVENTAAGNLYFDGHRMWLDIVKLNLRSIYNLHILDVEI